MRRMMHAAALLLASISQVHAQSASDKPASLSLKPALTQTAEVQYGIEKGDVAAIQFHATQRIATPDVIPMHAGRPYSQLAMFMNCNDWRPNLWDNYANERAAVVAHVSHHVDMQCKCFENKHCLHSHHSAAGCGDCSGGGCSGGGCNVANGTKVINRYRTPMSTHYATPSDSCGGSIANLPSERVETPVARVPSTAFSTLNPKPSYDAYR